MPATAQLRSANAVINWYNDQDQPAWKIYRFSVMDKNCTDQYNGNDKEAGSEKLQAALSYIAPDDYENYVLALFNPKDKDKKTPVINKVFVINERPMGLPAVAGGYGMMNPYNQVMTELTNEIRALRAERIAEDQEDEDSELGQLPDEDTTNADTERILDKVNKFLDNPLVQTIGAILIPKITARPLVQQISGTHTKEDLDKIIEVLFSKGVTVDDLATLSAMPKSQITMLLGMLRK